MNHPKYPRTPHLPWSPGATKDDVFIESASWELLKEVPIVITEKMDGENTTMRRDKIHARSLDSGDHPSRAWVKSMHAQLAWEVPDSWRICGENLYAKHSIYYPALKSYFQVFAIFDDLLNICMAWADTVAYAKLLGLTTVPVIYEGTWGKEAEQAIIGYMLEKEKNGQEMEGYVVRCAHYFSTENFQARVAKVVRSHHVQTTEHWMQEKVIPNGYAP